MIITSSYQREQAVPKPQKRRTISNTSKRGMVVDPNQYNTNVVSSATAPGERLLSPASVSQ